MPTATRSVPGRRDRRTNPRRDPRRETGPRLGVGAAIVALATGGFAIGTTEFVSMGLLPQLAHGVHVSIPAAGHAISAYALGVVIGAPVLAYLGAGLPRKALLLGLTALFVVAHVASALAPSYAGLLGARFLAGIPHGAYFGVASLVAADLVAPHRRGRAVSQVMLGLAVANVLGVPLATWVGQHAGWRATYFLVAGLGLLTAALVAVLVPYRHAHPEASGRAELAALRSAQVWLTLLIGAVGFGGMFSVITYLAPTVTDVAHLPESHVPFWLLVYGAGMVVGTALGGRLADWSVLRSLLAGTVGMLAMLALFSTGSGSEWTALPTLFGLSVLASVMVVALQMRLMHVAGSAQTLGAALNHAALNLANALGAWLGGVVVAAGLGYPATAAAGAVLSVVGLGVLAVSLGHHQATKRSAAR